MVYTPTYTTTDTKNAIVDIIGTVFAALVGFGALVGLVMLYRWYKGKKA